MSIEETYPSYADQIRQARAAGFSDEEIQSEFQSLIREQSSGGKSVRQIQAGLGQERPGLIQRLATSSLGDLAQSSLEALAYPVEVGAGAITGMIPPIAKLGAAGLADLVSMVRGDTVADQRALEQRAVRAVEEATPYIQYQPQGQLARTTLEVAGAPFTASEQLLEMAGLPEEQAKPLVEVAGLVLPYLYHAVKGRPPSSAAEMQRFIRDAREAEPLRSPEMAPRIKAAIDQGFTPEEVASELATQEAPRASVPVEKQEVSVEPTARGPEFFSTLKELGYSDADLREMPFAEKVRRARDRVPAETERPAPVAEETIAPGETIPAEQARPADIASRTPEEAARESEFLKAGQDYLRGEEQPVGPAESLLNPAEQRMLDRRFTPEGPKRVVEAPELVTPSTGLGEIREQALRELGFTPEQIAKMSAPEADVAIRKAARPIEESLPAEVSRPAETRPSTPESPIPGELPPQRQAEPIEERAPGERQTGELTELERAALPPTEETQRGLFERGKAALPEEAPFDIPEAGAELEPGSLGAVLPERLRRAPESPSPVAPTIQRQPVPSINQPRRLVAPKDLRSTIDEAVASRTGEGNVGAIIPQSLRRTPEQIRQEAGIPFTPSRQKIVSDLSKLLDVPIRYGKVQSKNVLGFFRVKPEVVRLKFAQDVEVAGHEVGHFLEKTLFKTTKEMRGGQGLTGKAFEPFADELTPIATQHNKSSSPVVEGFAEFVRRYVTNEPQARNVAPRFYEFFDNFLQKDHPDVRQVLLNARHDYETYLKAPATARVRAQISRMPEEQKWSARDVAHRYYTLLVDQLHPIAQLKESLVKGERIAADKDPELLARTFPGWSRKADLFLNKGPRDFDTLQKVGPGLDEITRPIRDRWEDFWDYAAARRAVGDIAAKSQFGLLKGNVEKLTGISLKDWQETYRTYDSPEFRKVFDQVQEYQSQVLDYVAKSYGLPEQYLRTLRALNANYVPFHRVMDDPNFPVERGPSSAGGSFGNQANAVKRFKGSQRQIIDPAESVIKNTFTLVNLAERNQVAKAMVDLARKVSGSGRYVEDVPFDRKPASFQLKEIKRTLEEAGVDVAQLDEGALDATATIFRANKMAPENHIMFWENGKQRLVRLDPELYKAMQRLDKESTNAFVKFLQPAADLLRAGATTTPEFGFRNPMRDQWSVAINTGAGIKTPYFTARGLFHVLKQDALYDQWLASGGAQASLVKLNRAEIIKRANEMGRDESTAKTFLRHPWQSVRLLSQLTEEASRLGVFEASLRGKEPTKANLLEAGAESREGSIDFQRMGAKTQALNQIVAFWNANLQGLDKVRRVAAQDPLGFATKVFAGITLPSIALTLYQMDDARWKEIPQWQKDTSWIWMTGPHVSQGEYDKMTAQEKRDLYRKTIWRIPKPFELGVTFGSIPERIVESIAGQHKGEVGKTLLQSLGTGIGSSLIPLPTMFAPVFENWANWSNFTGQPVVPKSLEDLEPGLQAKAQTGALAKKIGEAINYSPAKIDNLIRGYGGGLGIMGAEAASSLMDTVGIVDLPPAPSRTASDIPGIRGFTVRFPTSQAESIDTFWEKYVDSQEKVKSWKALLKEDRTAEAEKYYQENREQIERSKSFARGAEAMRGYSKAIGNIWKSTELSPEQKRDAIDALYVENIDVARAMLKTLYPQRQSGQP